MVNEKLYIATLANNDGCFDLQFRKDTRHERTGSPTYYRWKAQFIITVPKANLKTLKKVSGVLSCGKIHITKDQARFSVQSIGEISDHVIPFFNRNPLSGKKKKDFELWKKAVQIIHHNKGKYIKNWEKNDLLSLIEIHKSSVKYKQNPRNPKWITMARSFIKTS